MNENFKTHGLANNLNADKFGSNNLRDYDKEPLVIKSYERFFAYTIFFIPLAFSSLFLHFIFYNDGAGYFDMVVFLAILTFIVYIFAVVHTNHEIKFANKYIEFIEEGVVKRRCKMDKQELEFCFTVTDVREGFLKMAISDKVLFVVIAIVMLLAWRGVAVAMVFFMYLSNIILKLTIYLFLNKSLRGFRILPFLRVAEPIQGNSFQASVINMKYFSIYIYNEKIYKEIWRWFLQNGVNIDRVKRNYMFV